MLPEESRDFFISRAGEDSEWGQWIAQALDEEGYTSFHQPDDILAGNNFMCRMAFGLQNSPRMTAILSPDYLGG
ncbi:MAG: toll/interleukin-1 receptor domain-containing protein [Bryobacterales bacterium]|nr:toll/interleukin-1 receptor domain-containing protein [Bryobacterales bacterium]